MSRYNNNKNENSVTVEEFNIPKDKLEAVHEILSSNKTWYNKKGQLIAMTGIKQLLCCVCAQVSSPLYQVRYSGTE